MRNKNRSLIRATACLCIVGTIMGANTVKAVAPQELQAGYIDEPQITVKILDGEDDAKRDSQKKRIFHTESLKDDSQDVSFPEVYDARTKGVVTSVKDQSPYGSCWSFSMLAALESSLISDGLFDNSLDLSEAHLIKYAYTNVEDPLGGTKGDVVKYTGDNFMNAGYNQIFAYHTLANWLGAVEEVTDPYPGDFQEYADVSMEDGYLRDVIHLQQMYVLHISDVDAIKSYVMRYGCISGSMLYYKKYMNQSNGAYYYDEPVNFRNHAISIVGWDDNYSKENFLTEPSRDGAWLVKNSWGEEFGKEGYSWISYCDNSLSTKWYVFVAEKADNYSKNYQYDGSYMDAKVEMEDGWKVANVFQVDSMQDSKEVLKAVSFTVESNESVPMIGYEIQIYKNPVDEMDPESGHEVLANPVTGTAEYPGYYTIKLPEEVVFAPGDQFAVVVTFYGQDFDVVIEETGSWNGIQFQAHSEPGQSYMKNDKDWRDLSALGWGNLRIKAFTCPANEENPTKRIPFLDVLETDWEYPYVCYVYEKGIMIGLSNEEFGKNRNLTRAEFATVLYSMMGKPPIDYEEVFSDVPAEKWYSIPVVWAKKNGVTAGYGDRFGVADNITREQIVTMMYSFSGDAEKETKPSVENLTKFADADKISSWAKEAVAWSVENNIIVGKPLEEGKLFMDPLGYATRGECATIIRQYLSSRGEDEPQNSEE